MSALSEFGSARLVELCASDGEFLLAARGWTGGLKFEGEAGAVSLTVSDGRPTAGDPGNGQGVIMISGPDTLWGALLAAVPPRLENDLWPLVGKGQLALKGDNLTFAQYFAAAARVIELMRPASPYASRQVSEAARTGQFDSPTGRYIHLDLGGQDYRIYFEEAGEGIPLVLQHTAGCHGSQWRHLFEAKEVTDHFRLVAYDLPFHGKSLPPVGPKWWTEQYRLRADFLRSVPVTLSQALGLDRPVFMGCSIGGMLALDLARYYPDSFRAVISVEGALKTHIPVEHPAVQTMWDPRVSNDYKARMMDSLMSPTSPEAYRKETSQMYAAGWPQTFIGDLNYYCSDYDLREEAHLIDTSRVGVHILNGEYDYSGSIEAGREAHAAIAGSTWAAMDGVGHFGMSENPEKFLEHVLPILRELRMRSDKRSEKLSA
ncbi:alpha/beta hydrolase [Bradyrhizobium sp. B097]|uniref:alpha/beta fold hydrolase n=1 Tax=Bradyrhizobium sp. B097 TaxID=3140244 RepID=UPI003183A9A2